MDAEHVEVLGVMKATRTALDAVDNATTQCVEHEDYEAIEDIVEMLTPLEAAKLDVAFAYSIASLYYVLLRTKGVSQQTHPVKSELDRIKGYVYRLKRMGDAVATQERRDSPGTQTLTTSVSQCVDNDNGSGNTAVRDVSVAQRMIMHELGKQKKLGNIAVGAPHDRKRRKTKR